jgi:16S rRNA (guanine527-N7)-methyltransferase
MPTERPADDPELACFLRELEIPTSADWWESIRHFHALLRTANEVCNLTRITTWEDFLAKHVADSLLLVRHVPALRENTLRVADVGCGGGLPGIPLALTFAHLQVVEIDSVGKKIDQVRSFLQALALDGCEAVCGRARELARMEAYREGFDVVVARAVSATPELIREGRRLLAPNGILVAYKTAAQTQEERPKVEREAAKAGLTPTLTPVDELPGGQGERQFWLLARE